MRTSTAARLDHREHSGGSSSEASGYSLANSLGGTTPSMSPASQPDVIGLRYLGVRTLAGIFICWVLLVIVLVLGSTLLTSVVTPPEVTVPKSTGALPSEKPSAGWTAKRLCYEVPSACDVYTIRQAESPFYSKSSTGLEI